MAGGVEVVMNKFPLIAAELSVKAKEAEHAAAEAWAQAASAAAPVLTGALAASGHADGNEVIFDAVNEQGNPYGVYVEFGTHDTPAQPFLRTTEDAGRVVLETHLHATLEV